MDDERRLHSRHNAELQLEVFDLHSGQRLGRVADCFVGAPKAMQRLGERGPESGHAGITRDHAAQQTLRLGQVS